MRTQTGKQVEPARRDPSRPSTRIPHRGKSGLAILASLLPALCGACSWVQALQAPLFGTSFGDAGAQPLALPVTEAQVRMVYPDGTDTVGAAVSYMLEPHAYRPAYRDAPGEIIAQRGFIGNFDNEPAPLAVALERLVGRDGQIILDRERKLYAFRLRNPGEPGIAFADLGAESFAATAVPVSWEWLDQPVPAPDGDAAPGNDAASAVAGPPPGTGFKHAPACCKRGSVPRPASADETPAADPPQGTGFKPVPNPVATHSAADRDFCRSIQFRNRAMLSATVREYFLGCGFEEVTWKLGEPGRYADYRLSQDVDVPLPERHLDLVDLLQTRFGIMTLINEDNSVEFHDENNKL